MMRFTYEEDGITVTMETDATSLYEDYTHNDGVLGQFKRFLAAAGYTVDSADELTLLDKRDMVVDSEQYTHDMDELDRLREGAKSVSTTESSGQWIEWGGGEFPFDHGRSVEVELRNGDHLTLNSLECDWHHSKADGSDDIIAYRVVE